MYINLRKNISQYPILTILIKPFLFRYLCYLIIMSLVGQFDK